jgi:uncharacterized membrane protein
MSQKRESRIKLLTALEDLVDDNIETDPELLDINVRRRNRKLKKMTAEIKDWLKDLERVAKSEKEKKVS